MPKTVVDKVSFGEPKIEKVKSFATTFFAVVFLTLGFAQQVA